MLTSYRIVHTTTYDFAEWVPSCQLRAMLRPRPRPGLHCQSHLLSAIPLAQERETGSDRFGNPVERLAVRRRLRRLIVSAATTIEMAPEWSQPCPETVERGETDLARADGVLVPDDATRDTCLAYGAPALADAASPFTGVGELARQIYRDMIYDTRFVEVGRPVAELLREPHGMCQDYARLAIATLRTHGIPARWVVGYVLPGTRRNPVRRGSYRWLHAWFSAYLPERGWTDFDATDPAGDTTDLLTLAWGADEEDVNPLLGELGVEVSRQKVAVDITIDRLDGSGAALE